MEKHQILRPRQLRGTPSHRVVFKVGLAGIGVVIIGFFFSDYLRSERQEKRIQSGKFLLEDHVRWHSLMMGRLCALDAATSKTIAAFQEETKLVNMQEDSLMKPYPYN